MNYRKSLLAGLILAPLGLMVSGPVSAETMAVPTPNKVLQVADNEQNEQGNAESQEGNQDEGAAESNEGNNEQADNENENDNEQAGAENENEADGEKCVKNCPENGEGGENNN